MNVLLDYTHTFGTAVKLRTLKGTPYGAFKSEISSISKSITHTKYIFVRTLLLNTYSKMCFSYMKLRIIFQNVILENI